MTTSTKRTKAGKWTSAVSTETMLKVRDEMRKRYATRGLYAAIAERVGLPLKAVRARLQKHTQLQARKPKVWPPRFCSWCDEALPQAVWRPDGHARYCCVGCQIMATVKREGDCWVWQASRVQGYGQLHAFGQHRAHKASLICFTGVDIPEGAHVLHECDNRACVNPRHLRVGSALDNQRDAVAKGRNSRGEARPSAKLTDEIVRTVRADKVTGTGVLAKRYGVSRVAMSMARAGSTWRHVS